MIHFYGCLYRLSLIFFGLFLAFPTFAQSRGQLKEGRYSGWLYLTEKKEKLAVVADIFLESPEDLTQFPVLNASIRISIGGFKSHEYITETFKNLKADFDNGIVVFDESENDLSMKAQVLNVSGKSKILGEVFVRSVAASGTMELLEESDEPADQPFDVKPAQNKEMPIMSSLEGQYEGLCDGKTAALQIQTVRGLKSEGTETTGNGLEKHYGITARLGYKNDPWCGQLPNKQWCTRNHFSSGTFNFYTGKLTLKGDKSSEECALKLDTLTCSIQTIDKVVKCVLKKERIENSGPQFFSRRYNSNPTSEQNKELPSPSPPSNLELTKDLGGTFSGYIHNERNDTYIGIQLNVVPTSTTDNPHNPNQMIISATASMFLGPVENKQFYIQRFEPRSFYLRPGFVLSGSKADSFLTIIDWKKGFVRGIWNSHAFGKVGTVQLAKGGFPPLAKDAKIMHSFAGEFERTSPLTKLTHWVKFAFPSQTDDLQEQMIRFSGSYQAIKGRSPIRNVPSGLFDPYTGSFGWIMTDDETSTFGSGKMDSDGNALLFWPPVPIVGVTGNSFTFEKFNRRELEE